MKEKRPRIKKVRKEPSRVRKPPKNPPQITGFWGRGASEYRPGLFTKRYFVEHGEACCADVYYALSEEIERLNAARAEIGEAPFRRPNYSSFAKYFHWFKLLGLVERVDRREPAIYDFLEQREFYRLTDKGKVEVRGWEDPVTVAHPEFR
ncbi:unnamed protein product [marine sediment metagenome]|uniref:Uncharacterized protein n=1 Tax=marine sediment metagenome TaxID=412755 RepID=X0ZT54_9ZZZZ